MGDWHGVNFKTKGHISFNQGSTLPYVLELHRIDGLSKLKVSTLTLNLNLKTYCFNIFAIYAGVKVFFSYMDHVSRVNKMSKNIMSSNLYQPYTVYSHLYNPIYTMNIRIILTYIDLRTTWN